MLAPRIATCFAAFVLLLAPANVHGDEFRTWTDSTGKFQVEARFVEATDGAVMLLRQDGKRIQVPLEKLSEKDRELVKSLMAETAENPFEAPASPLRPGEVAEPSWEGATEIPLAAGDRWEISIGEAPKWNIQPKIAGLPKKRDFFEKLNGLALSVAGGKAVVSYTLGGRGRNPSASSRIVVVDLAAGRTLANATLEGTFVAIAMHDDGKRIVAERTQQEGSRRDKQHTLVTLTAEGDKATLLDEWIPYNNADEGARHVRFAAFAGEEKFVTCNEPGTVAVWDFASRKLLFQFNIPRTSIPALSPDRQYVAFAGGNKVGFVNLATREPVAMKAADGMSFWVKGEFSPSGKRFAASSQQKLMIWDVESGEVLFEGEVPGIALAFGLEFPAEDFVLLSKEYLVEWTSKIKVWQYSGGGPRECVGGLTFVATDEALVPLEIPHAEALGLLEEAKRESDLFVVKKGTPLAVEVSGVPDEYRAQVEQALKGRIEESGFKVDESAEVTINASVGGPKKDTVSYFRAGSFEIDRYTSTVRYEYQGKTIWSSSQSNVPGFLTTPRDKSYQQQIDEAGAKPNLGFFGSINLPDYLQRPAAGNAASSGGRGQQTLGASRVTATGLN